jgi:hypothetical protein
MKTKMIFAGLMVFIVMQVSAFELWNGFTTEMTKEQVISKATTELQVTREPRISNSPVNVFDTTGRISSISGSQTDITKNSQFFSPPLDSRYQKLSVYSPISSYAQPPQGVYWTNIDFYFFENKLYAVCIVWETTDIEQIAINRFGRITATLTEYIAEKRSLKEWSMWQLNDRLVYLNGRIMYMINRSLIEKWIVERLNEANQGVNF